MSLSVEPPSHPEATCRVRCGSATDLSFIPANSVDYVFIDPPWAIKYFDLSVLWCAWMGFSLPFEQEIFPHETEFEEDMARALRELARVLRPGRSVTVNFATRYTEQINALRGAIERSGLEWVGTQAIQQDQLSFVQRQTDLALKANYLLTLQKSGEAAATEAVPVTAECVAGMIHALLNRTGPLSTTRSSSISIQRSPMAAALRHLKRAAPEFSDGGRAPTVCRAQVGREGVAV